MYHISHLEWETYEIVWNWNKQKLKTPNSTWWTVFIFERISLCSASQISLRITLNPCPLPTWGPNNSPNKTAVPCVQLNPLGLNRPISGVKVWTKGFDTPCSLVIQAKNMLSISSTLVLWGCQMVNMYYIMDYSCTIFRPCNHTTLLSTNVPPWYKSRVFFLFVFRPLKNGCLNA